MRGLTPDSQLEEYLGEVVERLEQRLGDRLLGAWVVGSGALGDFDPQRSDVDVQAVASERLAPAELEALADELSHPALECPVRGLEFVLYSRAGLADPLGPAFQLNLNTGPGMRQHEGYDPAVEPRFWFVLDVAIARQQSRALAGATPAELLPELPRELVLSSLRDALAWWRDHDATGAIIATCRAWAWMDEGRWLSKGDAAAWAAKRLDDPAPVQRALAHREDATVPEPTAADVDRVVRTVQGMLPGG
jgi:hypothetical protein